MNAFQTVKLSWSQCRPNFAFVRVFSKSWLLQDLFLYLVYLLSGGKAIQRLRSWSLLFFFISPFETALCSLPAFNKIEDAVQE